MTKLAIFTAVVTTAGAAHRRGWLKPTLCTVLSTIVICNVIFRLEAIEPVTTPVLVIDTVTMLFVAAASWAFWRAFWLAREDRP